MKVSLSCSSFVTTAMGLFVRGSGARYGGRSDVPGRGRGYLGAYERRTLALNAMTRVGCIARTLHSTVWWKNDSRRVKRNIPVLPTIRKMVVWGIRPPDPPDPPEMAETLKF